jgi:hypothetical protein
MIARTAFTQLRYSSWLLGGAIAGMLFLYVVPVVAAVTGSVYGWAAWIAMTAAYMPLVRFYQQPVLSALLLPAAGIFYTLATIESAVAYWRGRGGNWKGRSQAAAMRQHGL